MSFTDLNLSSVEIGGQDGTGKKGLDQAKTNLCHSFATGIGLKRALEILLKGRKSQEVKYGAETDNYFGKQDVPVVVQGEKSADEILSDESQWKEKEENDWFVSYNICSTTSFISNIIGNVNPRAFAGLDGNYASQSTLAKQTAYIDKLLDRLKSPSMFECVGWKRILGVVKMFEAFGLDPEEFELVARKTSHPTSIGIPRFLAEIIKAKTLKENDPNKVKTTMDEPWFTKLENTNFVVSRHNEFTDIYV